MIKNFGQRLKIEFQVLSLGVYSVPTHWVGRSVPCAGQDCPMCVLRQPRSLFFAGLRFERESAVYEIPSSLERAIFGGWRNAPGDEIAGVCVSATRLGPRDEWRPMETRRAQLAAPKIHQQQVAAAVAELYRLEKPMLAETFVEWFERTRSGQAVVLQAAVLPFGGEKSSHQMLQDRRS